VTATNGTLTINQATATVTADNKSKTYGQTVTFAGTEFTTGGFINGDSVTSVTLTSAGAAATATVTAPGPDYPIVPSAAVGSGLGNYTISYVNGNLHVNTAPLTIKAENRTKTFGDTYTADTTTPSLDFTVTDTLYNGDTVTSIMLTSAGYAAGATVAGSPYTITPSAAVGTGLGNYTISYVNGSLTVIARAALVNYIGQTTFVTSGTSSTTAQVTLSASVQDPTGTALVGATMDFIDTSTGKALASGVKVSPVPNQPNYTGTANTIVTLSSGQYGAESYEILVVMTGNYNNTAQAMTDKTADVVVAKPASTNQTTGGGQIVHLTAAAGTYAGSASNVTYSIGMTYNKSGANLQGKITVAIPQTGGSVIYVKSNSISSMAVTGVPGNKNSTIYTKATVYQVMGNGSQVTIDGNVTLRVDALDNTMSDGVGFTVLSSKDSTLYYSNNWLLSSGTWKTVLEGVTYPTSFVTIN